MIRLDKRQDDEIRNTKITPDFIKTAPGSALIEVGDTRVITTATILDKVPSWMDSSSGGWLSAEYSMLPGSTLTRKSRDRKSVDSRSIEIQRLIGRSLRSIIDLSAIGNKAIMIDCDVIQADGGTRTASITGAFVALCMALEKLIEKGDIKRPPIKDYIAAISVGYVKGEAVLDLCYQEDYAADVDMNVVMLGNGNFAEIQGTGEHDTFTNEQLSKMLFLAEKGIKDLMLIQKNVLGDLKCIIK